MGFHQNAAQMSVQHWRIRANPTKTVHLAEVEPGGGNGKIQEPMPEQKSISRLAAWSALLGSKPGYGGASGCWPRVARPERAEQQCCHGMATALWVADPGQSN